MHFLSVCTSTSFQCFHFSADVNWLLNLFHGFIIRWGQQQLVVVMWSLCSYFVDVSPPRCRSLSAHMTVGACPRMTLLWPLSSTKLLWCESRVGMSTSKAWSAAVHIMCSFHWPKTENVTYIPTPNRLKQLLSWWRMKFCLKGPQHFVKYCISFAHGV